ncbi:MAG: ribosome small subunit-dependent GTPase A [Deltaproteobacteria bacterium]|nr:ribosome small subunit-dependent GTPase A [Deltaproteobacteria bacterium]
MPDLDDLGWGTFSPSIAASEPEAALRPGRVASVYGTRVDVWLPGEEAPRMVAVRRMAKREAPIEGGIAVGDWVLVASATEGSQEVVVERVLPRRTAFLRQAAGERAEPQAIAANVDRVLVVTSVDGDFNLRRLDRYLVAIAGGGAEPVIVLAKADLATELSSVVSAASALAPTIVTSAKTGVGIDELRAQAPRGTTVALVGSSGVGKSALVNVLLGRDAQAEGAVREHDNRGRHTTTRRSLFLVPSGGLVVDTPGMRELTPWQAGEAGADDLEEAFADIVDLASACRYRDCKHAEEPGCAIRSAVDAGELDAARVASWTTLERERTQRKARQDAFAGVQEKRRARASSVALRKHLATKRGR